MSASTEDHPYVDSIAMSSSEDSQVDDEDFLRDFLQSTALSRQDWIKGQQQDREACLILYSPLMTDNKQAESL